MSLQTVHHITFGKGYVASLEGKYVTVIFDKDVGEKMFVYPDAFGKYLEYEDSESQSIVEDLLHKKEERRKQDDSIKAEALERAKKYAEEEQRKTLSGSRTTARKTVKRKKTVEEVLDEVIK